MSERTFGHGYARTSSRGTPPIVRMEVVARTASNGRSIDLQIAPTAGPGLFTVDLSPAETQGLIDRLTELLRGIR